MTSPLLDDPDTLVCPLCGYRPLTSHDNGETSVCPICRETVCPERFGDE